MRRGAVFDRFGVRLDGLREVFDELDETSRQSDKTFDRCDEVFDKRDASSNSSDEAFDGLD